MREIKYNNITWLDTANPSIDDIAYLRRNFKIHSIALEEFSTPTLRPKATLYDDDCIFLTVHIPLFDSKNRTTFPGELDIVLNKRYLITGHQNNIFQLNDFFKELSKSEEKRAEHMNQSPAHLLYQILKILIESCFPKLDHIIVNLNRIEEEIFHGHEKEMVREISIVKRDILNFRRTLKPQRSVLESIYQMESEEIVPRDLRVYFQDLIGTNIRLWNTLESTKETVESLEETNNSLLSNNLNLTMKVLTIFSAITLPMTVYSNIMSMTTSIPLAKENYAFWFHVGVMLTISAVTIFIFRSKKWL